MTGMTGTIGTDYGFIALWALHVLSVIVFFTGVLFFIVLAIKTFSPARLKQWAVWLMVIGTVVCLFTIAMLGKPWVGIGFSRHTGMRGMPMQQMQMMGQMMETMMQHDRQANTSEGKEHGDMMKMMRMMMGSPAMSDDVQGSDSQ